MSCDELNVRSTFSLFFGRSRLFLCLYVLTKVGSSQKKEKNIKRRIQHYSIFVHHHQQYQYSIKCTLCLYITALLHAIHCL